MSIDSSSIVVVKYVYDAWGNHKVLDSDGNIVTSGIGLLNPFRYRGYYYDPETKLYYLQTRYYDPEIGRFISQDSVEYADPESINGLNLYAYCGNNPVMAVDPTGTFWSEVRDWFSTITGLFNLTSKLTALGAVIVAACQGRGSEIAEDWNNGCFNPFNQSEDIAFNSKVFSFYKGESVIRIPNEYVGMQLFGNIFLGTDSAMTVQDLNHEFGHGIQERLLGVCYLKTIALPSVITCAVTNDHYIYFSMPWERTADWFGGVNRSTGYKNGSLGWAIAENIVGVGLILWYFIFGY